MEADLKFKKCYPDGNYHSTVHEITAPDHGNGVGHMGSTYLPYTRGPDKFLPNESLNIRYLGYHHSPNPTPNPVTSSSTSHSPFWVFLLVLVVVVVVAVAGGACFLGLLRDRSRNADYHKYLVG